MANAPTAPATTTSTSTVRNDQRLIGSDCDSRVRVVRARSAPSLLFASARVLPGRPQRPRVSAASLSRTAEHGHDRSREDWADQSPALTGV